MQCQTVHRSGGCGRVLASESSSKDSSLHVLFLLDAKSLRRTKSAVLRAANKEVEVFVPKSRELCASNTKVELMWAIHVNLSQPETKACIVKVHCPPALKIQQC
jgi:hypothetical protein